MDIYSLSAVVVLLVAVVFAIVQNRKKSEQIKQFEERFAEVLDVDKEVESVTAQKVEVEGALRELRSSYAEKRAIFDKLVKESAIYDEMVQLAELGFYKPHFDFDASEEYKNLIGDVRGAQKKMLTEKTAIFSSKEWVLDGSKAKGKTMMNRGIRLTARAFNNECEAAVSNVSWNNVQRMEQRIGKAFDAINKLNESQVVFDVHAMIYTEDAPTVENVMQKSFDSRRVNLVNNRKEFFNVTLGDIRGELLKSFPEAEFVEVGEAKEYRETLALREQLANVPVAATERGGPRNSDRLLRWDPDHREGVWNVPKETELPG